MLSSISCLTVTGLMRRLSTVCDTAMMLVWRRPMCCFRPRSLPKQFQNLAGCFLCAINEWQKCLIKIQLSTVLILVSVSFYW